MEESFRGSEIISVGLESVHLSHFQAPPLSVVK